MWPVETQVELLIYIYIYINSLLIYLNKFEFGLVSTANKKKQNLKSFTCKRVFDTQKNSKNSAF